MTTIKPVPQATSLLIDRFLPHSHFELVTHRIIDAPVTATYSAARELDFTEIRGSLVGLAGWVRALPERWHDRRLPRTPTRMTVDDLSAGSAWVLLGDRPDEEFAIGVAGEFWRPVIRWRNVDPGEFAAYEEPGCGKLVLAVSVRPYGLHRSLLSVETRVHLTDPSSWLKFRRHWRLAGPFVRAIQRAMIKNIAQEARQKGLR